MLHQLKAFVPESLIRAYHYFLARFSSVWYGNPSNKLIVIGVTGTNGKTTTTYMIAKALEASGYKVGCTTTALMKVGDDEWVNRTKMTMPGRFFLQRMLVHMIRQKCRYAVIETSSQGLTQFRHLGINYDVAVFTNLTPEHIEAHGGFENYKKAKRLLFEHLVKSREKIIDGKRVEKVAILNADSEHAEYYAQTPGLKRIEWFGVKNHRGLFADQMEMTATGSTFKVGDSNYAIQLPGEYNIENAMGALATAQALGINLKSAAECLSKMKVVPGRFERVEAGQPWTVIVDYAPEPESFRRLYEALALVPHQRIIHVLGSCGGGRDVARRPILGRLAAQNADIVIATNEDPYDDDPKIIMDQVAAGAIEAGKKEGETLFKILDREQAIQKAMDLAQKDDLVVMTGKGCEFWMCVAGGKKIPWDEVVIAREAIEDTLKARALEAEQFSR